MPVITICGQGPSAERAHVAVNLAAEAALGGRTTLLIDLDPQASATRQLFRDPLDQSPNLESLVLRGGPLTEHTRTLRLYVRSWVVFTRSWPLHVIPGARRLEGKPRVDAATQLRLLLVAAQKAFDVVVADAPGLADALGRAAAVDSDRLVPVIRAGPAADHEIESYARQSLAQGVRESAILHLLVGTEINRHLGALSRESVTRLVERARRESRPIGRVLQTEIRHDVALAATRSLDRTRADWVRFAAEVLADCETRLPQRPTKQPSQDAQRCDDD